MNAKRYDALEGVAFYRPPRHWQTVKHNRLSNGC